MALVIPPKNFPFVVGEDVSATVAELVEAAAKLPPSAVMAVAVETWA